VSDLVNIIASVAAPVVGFLRTKEGHNGLQAPLIVSCS